MDSTMLDTFMQAIRMLQSSGAKIEHIQVDKKTSDQLKFYLAQRDIRRTKPFNPKLDHWSHVELYGVPVVRDLRET